ncbi:LysR family transcriptional regulator [Nitrogeniibacter aestuarii]|uniref:LysR family transcriptional regulator n=1 Tax=Nitrogeniibacter aestuarii TaxID=2815343 RepID=UPI0022AB0024|nr:LysR family transcriptional regulator [Nitrogeniibacter aestuarii]
MSFTIDPSLLPALASFECVARHQSFSRAAEELGISTSALSQTIRGLETRLAMRLLARTTRRVNLTEEGAALLVGVREGLASLSAALDRAEASTGRPSGSIRITLPRLAYFNWFLPKLASFRETYPDVEVEFGLDDHLVDLVAEGFDLGVRIGEQLDADMVAVPMGEPVTLVTVASSAYLARHGTPASPEDLQNHECSRYRFATSGRLSPWMFQRDGQPLEVSVSGKLIINDLSGEIALAKAGLAVVQTVASVVREEIARGELVRILADYEVVLGRMYLYFPSRTHMPLRVRAFIDHFRDNPMK